MTGFLFALLLDPAFYVCGVSLALVILAAAYLIFRAKVRRGRWWRFGISALCVGPSIRFLVGNVWSRVGSLHPGDMNTTIWTFAVAGTDAGILCAIAFGVVALLSRS